jgi:hypothetical protein
MYSPAMFGNYTEGGKKLQPSRRGLAGGTGMSPRLSARPRRTRECPRQLCRSLTVTRVAAGIGAFGRSDGVETLDLRSELRVQGGEGAD